MSTRYKGSVLSATAATNSLSTAVGIWRPNEVLQAVNASLWPLGVTIDPYFNYVSLLLHGDGTNGAQNNTFLDSSTNNFTITRNGNTTQGTFTPYGDNWSNYFDGATATRLTLPSNVAFAFGTGAYTIEAWVFLTAYAATQGSVFDSGNAAGALDLYITSTGALGLGEYGVGTVFNSSAGAVTLNSWNHVAIVRSSTATNDTKLYANGVLVGTGTNTKNWTVTTTPSIGGINLAGYSTAGYISNLRVVKGTAVYTAAFTPSTTPLTAISGTGLLTCQSNRFIDNSTNAFTITRNGTITIQRFNPFNPILAYNTSVIGGSGYFDGTGDYLTAPSSSAYSFGSNSFTVEFWIRTTQTTSNATLITREWGGTPFTGGWTIQLNGGSSSAMTIYWADFSTSATFMVASTTAYRDNAWHHVAWVRNGTSFVLYLDGVSVATATNSTAFGANAGQLTIANDQTFGSGARAYNGFISNLRIVNGTAIYTAAFTPPTAPVTAVTNTSLLLNYTNAGIYDNAMMNDLETLGSAQVSTSVVKFGTGSMSFNGTNSYLTVLTQQNFNFGVSDFTVEMWVYYTAVVTYAGLIDARATAGTVANWGLGLYTISATNRVDFVYGATRLTTTTAISALTWTHIAVVRSGGVIKVYINGTADATTATTSIAIDAGATTAWIGAFKDPYYLNGYIDDLRITKGYARYTTNFSVPTLPFPNQ